MKKATIILIIAGICLFLGYWFYPQTLEEQAFNEFLTIKTKAPFVVVPLCNAGKKVVPLVIERVKDKNLESRRWAIRFLGSGDYLQAIPVLENIVKDKSEMDYIRGEALYSIYFIDKSLGKRLANSYQNRSDTLGEVANEIIQNKTFFKREEICNPTF